MGPPLFELHPIQTIHVWTILDYKDIWTKRTFGLPDVWTITVWTILDYRDVWTTKTFGLLRQSD